LGLNANDVVTHTGLGYALLLKGRVNESLTHLLRAVEIAPKYPDSAFHLANTFLTVGRTEEALLQLQEVLTLDPGDRKHRKTWPGCLPRAQTDNFAMGPKAVQLAESRAKRSQTIRF